jgi:hypothetical protein
MALKYDLEVRSIALENQSIAEKHGEFVAGLVGLEKPWGVTDLVPAPDAGSSLSATMAWAKVVGNDSGVGGYVMYKFRQIFQDKAFYDDKIMLSFNPYKIDYRALVDIAFPRYIDAFNGYYAQIVDQEFLSEDWDKLRPGFDARHDLYRIPPVCYLREDFCNRALNLKPSDIVDRLKGRVSVARELLGGVIIILTYDILPTAEMDRLCWETKTILLDKS